MYVWPWRSFWRLRSRHRFLANYRKSLDYPFWNFRNDTIGPFLGKRFTQSSFFSYGLKHFSCHVRVRLVEHYWYSINSCVFTRGNRFDGRDYFRFTRRSLWYAASWWNSFCGWSKRRNITRHNMIKYRLKVFSPSV